MAKSWYVLRSKPNKEDFLAEQLLLRKVEAYSPWIRVQPVNPRSRKVRPYFPGYLFIHEDIEAVGPSILQYIPGASGLVMFGADIPSVPDGLVRAIQGRVDEINAAGGELLQAVKPGQTVLIHSGPFAGYEAIFDASLPGTERVRVLLKLLKDRQVPVDLPAGQIRLKNRPR